MLRSFSFIHSLIFKTVLLILLLTFGFMAVRFFSKKAGLEVNLNRAAVVKEMRALDRLETAVFTIEKIIDARTTGNVFQEILFGDQILLIAHGQVIAGFDLSQLTEDSISIRGKSVILHLPPPQILVTKLDSAQTRVYDRRQGLLARAHKDLESEARAQAEKSIQTAACDAGILNQASENGRKQLTSLLAAFQFSEITIEVPTGHCPQ